MFSDNTCFSDHVLDQNTRLKLLNLMNNGTLTEIGGVIATGKDALFEDLNLMFICFVY